MKNSFYKASAPWFLGLVGGVLLLVATSWAFDWPVATKTAASQVSIPVVVDKTPLVRENRFTASFSSVVKKAAPSVVNVSTTKTVKRSPVQPFFDDPFFRKFFGDQFGESPSGRAPRSFKEHSLGSGVVVTADGYILTNNHVVDGSDEIKVTLANSKKDYVAKVVGRDDKTDIAVLKIDAKDLPVITMGDSSKVEVGDVALAIGSPFGLSQTVTMGIVSATGRGGMGIEDYEDFIQTDAAINPGNSGGALVDAEGRLIGINTAILSRTGGNQGIGFAIPVNMARDVMERLIKYGKVDRGYLGVWLLVIAPALAQQFNSPKTQGALISEVTPDSAAAEAGLKPGDVIVEFNGKPVTDTRQLKFMVGETAPGAKVPVKVLRQGKEQTFTVKLKEMADETSASASQQSNASASDVLQGVGVSDIDAAARQQLHLPSGLQGAVVTEVDPDSAAYDAGLREGDVIQEINHQTVHNADEAVAATKNVKSKVVLLRIWSQGGSRFLVVDESNTKSKSQ
ncbi:MAG: DegQ family serine endoprotease [Candidatus Omnitrophica bacterium]|nr:DegQ family serine endoprotease [Candidatus Omnitrophota bacterium]